jgi:hypothetical protein
MARSYRRRALPTGTAGAITARDDGLVQALARSAALSRMALVIRGTVERVWPGTITNGLFTWFELMTR